jgi:hypothetical protein
LNNQEIDMERTLKRNLAGLAGTIALSLAASTSYALPTLLTPDGAVDPFGGFDWNQAGSSMVNGTISNGSAITTQFMSNAIAVNLAGGGVFPTPNMFPVNPAGTYEYTVFAQINETVSCVNVGAVCGSTANFTATGGTYWIFFDTTPDSNLVTGTGVTDGTQIIRGSINGGGGSFNLVGAGGIGAFFFTGTVDFTNSTFVSNLSGSTAGATLQFGAATTNWTQPTGFALFPPSGGTQPISGLLVQTDANQTFRLPEPGSLLLLSTVLGAIGLGTRRRKLT